MVYPPVGYPPGALVTSCTTQINNFIQVDLLQTQSTIDTNWVSNQLLQAYSLAMKAGRKTDDATIQKTVYEDTIKKVTLMYIDAKRYRDDTYDLERPTTSVSNSKVTHLIDRPISVRKQRFEGEIYRNPIDIN